MTDTTEPDDWNYPGLPRFAKTMERWFYHEQRIAFDNAVEPDGVWRLFLGVLVYGDYVERFLRLCVPVLLAPGNLPALDQQPTIIIHTDRASVDRIVAGVEAKLTSVARVEVHIIPDDIIAMVPENPANKYWLLGAAHNLHMQQAKYRCHAYHMLMPDQIFADGYFANLVRLKDNGAQAIVQGGLSAKLEEMTPELEARNGVIAPDELMGLALENLHPQLDAFIMNQRDDLPGSLLLVMIGQKAVHIISPHMSIIYLSHDVLMRAPVRLFNTIDGQLPWFIPQDVEPVVPGPDDGMVYVELSDKDKPGHWGNDGCTVEQFCARFWVMVYCVRGFERYFGLSTVLPVPAGCRLPVKPMGEAEIDALKRNVRAAVKDSHAMTYAMLPERLRIDPLDWVAQQQKKCA